MTTRAQKPDKPLVLRADDRSRLPMLRLGVNPGDFYSATLDDSGVITLRPLQLSDPPDKET